MTYLKIGDRVKDPEGDIGLVRRLGPSSIIETRNDGPPTLGPPASYLIEWETLHGGATPVTMQGSWEDIADLELVDG